MVSLMELELIKHINETIEELYDNNAIKLRQMCYKEMMKFGGLYEKDYDDFYSRVNLEISKVICEINHGKINYNPDCGKSFIEYIAGVIHFAVRKEMSGRNRYKRKSDRLACSIETPVGDSGVTIGDTLEANFNIDSIILNELDNEYSENIDKYLNQLNSIQKSIIRLKMEGIPISNIKRKLKITDKQYNSNIDDLKSFAKINALYRNESNNKENKEDDLMSSSTQTMENCKTDRISISSIVKKIDKHTIRFDHPLQRESDQWSPAMKGNLVSDILQGNKLNPLIFAEQIINGIAIIWDLDGKQRCTNAYSFVKNGYKISKNIRRWLIKYQTIKKDKNGYEILDENGFPIAENAAFDIRGKKFDELPEELQDRFLDYTFNYDQYLNCTEEDIGYHIERYNDGKHMTTPQKGIIKLGTEYAEMVKSISNMPFFKDMGGYKVSEFKNGTINRVVVESIMAANYITDWKKTQEDMCKYIKDNATSLEFDNFEDMVERLEKVIIDEVSDLFDSKDSFLWFGLFARFSKLKINDNRFIEFMAEFTQSLHSKKINDISFDDLNGKSTKDKSVVINKMKHLESIMYEFLKINNENFDEGLSEVNSLDFIKENVNPDTTVEDVEFYKDILDDLTINVDNNTKLLEKHNENSLLGIIAYSCDNDIDLEDWIVDFFNRNKTYKRNQVDNYNFMKRDLINWSYQNGQKSA